MFQTSKRTASVVGLACIAGCTSELAQPAASTTAEPVPVPIAASAVAASEVAFEYRALRKMTPKPVSMHVQFAWLCREVPSGPLVDGPHAWKALNIYMNESAAETIVAQGMPWTMTYEADDGMRASSGVGDRASTPDASGLPLITYPVGSVVVKEKLPGWNDSPPTELGPVGYYPVGGMIKRAPGYDPEHGDWEYFYMEGASSLVSGQIESCVDCHTRARATDYVFGGWTWTGIQEQNP